MDLDRTFELSARGTNPGREVLAGLTTFLTMVYIVVVNPIILGQAHVPFERAFFATVVATILGTLWMGLRANYPIAVAPGMGLNAFFAFSVVGSAAGIDYRVAFGAVFVAGVLFVILSVTRFREDLLNAIPASLKHAVTAGIGLFIAFIGLRLSGIVTAHETNLVALGNLKAPQTLLSLFGLLVTLVLYARRVPGAIFLGMLVTAVVAASVGMLSFENGFFSLPRLPADGLFVIDPVTPFVDLFRYHLYTVVLAFLIITLFDTTGTMIGIAEQAGLLVNGRFPRAREALLADSVATSVGALLGTSPTSAYIESGAGVAAGGRTGLTAVSVAGFFLLTLFFFPAVQAVAGLPAITAPALILVGSLMLRALREIPWDEFDEAFPAFLVILSMPLTSSIATGIALGFSTYPILKLVRGRGREVHPLLYFFAVVFLIQLFFLPHV
ncbi:MAG: Xanthine/uracil/thiamine/ascorbate permease family protein [Brockia lithotrophica]|uniref:Xanthine/uracil/thiamine/ascorbate permease family protein n=1 Tax=Brockia lithotrophica TaxID=933949 RepID=A0A2T5G8T0_9BACL|nr:MAG: Xanthine/uracil/thiamine/ascorbate permease family protein [Brockia lithotrophica]